MCWLFRASTGGASFAMFLLQNLRRHFSSEVIPRIVSPHVFPDAETQRTKRGTGGRSSWNGQVITVFGATGFLGRHLVNRLSRNGTQIIVPFRGDSHFARQMKLAGDLGQVLFTHVDLRDSESLARAMRYSNVVINLIGKELETTNFSFDDVHVHGAREIARLAAQNPNVKRFVHVSALNCCAEPEPHVLQRGSGFLRSKWFGECAVRAEFPSAIVFRPSDLWGHEDAFFFSLAKYQRRQIRKLPVWNGGYGVFKQPLYVSDLARAIQLAITDDDSVGRTYDAIGPRRYEFRELAEYVQRCIQKVPADGHRVTNLRWSPVMRMRISFLSQKRLFKYPVVHWEKIEREMVTDTPTPGNLTLEDLGVQLTHVEERLWGELEGYRRFGFYSDETNEFPIPDPPKVTPSPVL